MLGCSEIDFCGWDRRDLAPIDCLGMTTTIQVGRGMRLDGLLSVQRFALREGGSRVAPSGESERKMLPQIFSRRLREQPRLRLEREERDVQT